MAISQRSSQSCKQVPHTEEEQRVPDEIWTSNSQSSLYMWQALLRHLTAAAASSSPTPQTNEIDKDWHEQVNQRKRLYTNLFCGSGSSHGWCCGRIDRWLSMRFERRSLQISKSSRALRRVDIKLCWCLPGIWEVREEGREIRQRDSCPDLEYPLKIPLWKQCWPERATCTLSGKPSLRLMLIFFCVKKKKQQTNNQSPIPFWGDTGHTFVARRFGKAGDFPQVISNVATWTEFAACISVA